MPRCEVQYCPDKVARSSEVTSPVMCAKHWLELPRAMRWAITDARVPMQNNAASKEQVERYRQLIADAKWQIVEARALATLTPVELDSNTEGALCEGHIPAERFFELVSHVTGDVYEADNDPQYLWAVVDGDEYKFIDSRTPESIPITYVTE